MNKVILTTEEELTAIINKAIESRLANLVIPSPVTDAPQVLTEQQLCKFLSISLPTCIRWRQRGEIPCMRIGGNIRYRLDRVLKALER